MCKTASALGLALSILSVGCGESPEVSGKVTFTRLAIMDQDGGTYTIDTGHDGKDSLTSNDEWGVRCWRPDPVGLNLINTRTLNASRFEQGFSQVTITGYADGHIPPDKINVSVMLDGAFYAGTCPVTYKKTNDDPYEADFAVPTCIMDTIVDFRGRIEARFHVKACDPSPPL